jgi:Integrase core domain
VDGAREVFTRAFATYGLPQAIGCETGAPFGSQGAGGLTRLSAWWLRLGVEPHFIRPASPQENGRHERMHRTLKKETSQPPAADAEEQQARFDAFRRHYNEERPHEALGQRPPADLYAPSPRAMPEGLEDPWYDADHQVRRVGTRGEIKWRGDFAFVSEAVVGELVGLAELENGNHVVRFCGRDLGLLDRRTTKTVDHQPGLNCRGSVRLNTALAEEGVDEQLQRSGATPLLNPPPQGGRRSPSPDCPGKVVASALDARGLSRAAHPCCRFRKWPASSVIRLTSHRAQSCNKTIVLGTLVGV